MNKFLDIDLIESLSHGKGYIKTVDGDLTWESFLKVCRSRVLVLRFYRGKSDLFGIFSRRHSVMENTLSVDVATAINFSDVRADKILLESYGRIGLSVKPIRFSAKLERICMGKLFDYILDLPCGRICLNIVGK